MAKYNSADFQIWFDNSGGTPVDMSAYITDADEWEKEIESEETTPFSAADETHASAGVSKGNDRTLKGLYDDTATTGPHAIFNAKGSIRTLKYVYGGGKYSEQEHLILSYTRGGKVKNLTSFEVKLKPTGAVTEA